MLYGFGQQIALNRASPNVRTVRRKKSNHGLAFKICQLNQHCSTGFCTKATNKTNRRIVHKTRASNTSVSTGLTEAKPRGLQSPLSFATIAE